VETSVGVIMRSNLHNLNIFLYPLIFLDKVSGYGISLGVSQNCPFPKALIMPTSSENVVGKNERN
jgi:hypothetical protein